MAAVEVHPGGWVVELIADAARCAMSPVGSLVSVPAAPWCVVLNENIPAAEDKSWQTGKSKEIEQQKSVRIVWPADKKEAFEVFDKWHEIVMKQVNYAKISFRLAAIFRRYMSNKEGAMFASNATIAEVTGGCAVRTITRDVKAYIDLGVIKTQFKGRQDQNPVRHIYPAIPASLAKARYRYAGEGQVDIRCLCVPGGQVDNVCRVHIDNSCPPDLDNGRPHTLELTHEMTPERLGAQAPLSRDDQDS